MTTVTSPVAGAPVASAQGSQSPVETPFPKKGQDIVAMGVLLIALCCHAMGGIFVRISELGPIATAFYRVTFALPLALIWMSFDRQAPHLSPRHLGKPQLMALLGGAFLGVDLALWHKSFYLTTVANANLLANLMPFILVPLNVLIFRRYPKKLFLYGLLCACVGLALLVGGKAEFTHTSIQGDALALATAVFYALYLLITGTLRDRYSTSSLVFWSALGCALFLLPLAMTIENNLAITTTNGWLVLFALACVSQIGGQGLLAYSMGRIGINLSSAFVLLQPVIAAVYAYFLFRETFTWLEFCGGLIILAGVYIAKKGCQR